MQSNQVQHESSTQLRQELLTVQERLNSVCQENEHLSNKVSLFESQIVKVMNTITIHVLYMSSY